MKILLSAAAAAAGSLMFAAASARGRRPRRHGCAKVCATPDSVAQVPRLLREPHLGSIWEGTGNIVAQDVLRAIRCEGALDADLDRLDREAGANEYRFSARERAQAFARSVAESDDTAHARQAASGLYYSTAATLLAWEGKRIGSAIGAQRTRLSKMVGRHKLSECDPLAPQSEEEFFEA